MVQYTILLLRVLLEYADVFNCEPTKELFNEAPFLFYVLDDSKFLILMIIFGYEFG